MKIRGERECSDCGTRWSYYETGSVTCPECGSLRSVGVDDRKRHTAGAVDLDLTPVRTAFDEDAPLREIATEAAEVCASYCRTQGFVDAGELRPLGTTYLAAAELRGVGSELGRRMRHTDDEELYFLSLLRGADRGTRPSVEDVPESLWGVRGLALAAAVDDYVRDLRLYLDDDRTGIDEPYRDVVSRLTERRKRVEALDGDVDPTTVERLVRVAHDLGVAIAAADENALASARQRLDDSV
ncbi:MAG: TFIIB-type zinc ribbon-containing protein [Haloarculaceae archaeon]